ncbi:uncharacterized protein LOC143890606 [Tasmannia lanceolata]|uniref:uncharacterized protein LOC143890606 n=1 Tax=Tasmannia lanceolata TaxID=3420 RepID=UPI004063BCAB
MAKCFSFTATRDWLYRYSFSAAGLRSSTVDLGDGTTIHCWVPQNPRQDHPSLLLIHGFGANATWQWSDHLRPLILRFNVYVPDLIFFGDSFTTRPERTESFQAQCIMAMMESFGVTWMSLIGISYGGFVGYSMAAQFPEKVEKVVLCCAGVCLDEGDLQEGLFPAKDAGEAANILLPQTPERLRQLIRLSFYRPRKTLPTCFLTDFIDVMCTEYVEEKTELIQAIIKDRKFSDLPKITQPTLILWGEQDQIFPLELGHTLKRHLEENSKLVIIKHAGHAVNLEMPKKFCEHLKEFLVDSAPQGGNNKVSLIDAGKPISIILGYSSPVGIVDSNEAEAIALLFGHQTVDVEHHIFFTHNGELDSANVVADFLAKEDGSKEALVMLSEMAKLKCFPTLVGKKKKSKEYSQPVETNKEHGTLQVKLEHLPNCLKEHSMDTATLNLTVPFGIQRTSTCQVKKLRKENLVRTKAAYEGRDEHEENLSMERNFSYFDLQAQLSSKGEETDVSMTRNNSSCDSINTGMNKEMNYRSERDEDGHVSDPGIGQKGFHGSPKLNRSCSNVETRDVLGRVADQLPRLKSHSIEVMQKIAESPRGEFVHEIQTSPSSAVPYYSADRVMLKKRSSSQVLPSRSRRIWWKLFLWSHRNLHVPVVEKSIHIDSDQKGGYLSDIIEPSWALDARKKATGSNSGNNQKRDHFHGNQWVAFSPELLSPLARVDEWLANLNNQCVLPLNDCDEEAMEKSIVYPPSPDISNSARKNLLTKRSSNLIEEVLHANSVVQSLNSLSNVAHIAGMGLKAIPTISKFSSLRSVNLSGNFIVHITSGSLPKSLHILNLSRNKISTIEGLRELTRLRALDLSYNRISQIGRGLSNCTGIKELYLAGNNISEVEGLHRLKLTILDVSFNKITTTRALGQLVANYQSLLALNLLGNPIQSNFSEDRLRKVVSSLLPRLVYLNKQPIKPQRGRDLVKDSVARVALRQRDGNSRRKVSKRMSQSSSTLKSGFSHHRSKSIQRRDW